MKLMSILLASGMKSVMQSFVDDYILPIAGVLLVVGVIWSVVKNYDLINDADGQGKKKEGLMNVAWSVGYIFAALAVLVGMVTYIGSNLKATL